MLNNNEKINIAAKRNKQNIKIDFSKRKANLDLELQNIRLKKK